MAAGWTLITLCITSLGRRDFVTTVLQIPRDSHLIGVASCGHKNKMNNSECQALPLDVSLAKGLKQADSVLINTYTHAERVKKCNLYNLTQLPALQVTTEQSCTHRLVTC